MYFDVVSLFLSLRSIWRSAQILQSELGQFKCRASEISYEFSHKVKKTEFDLVISAVPNWWPIREMDQFVAALIGNALCQVVPFCANFWISLQMVLYVPFDCLGPVASLFGPDFPLGPHLGPHGCELQKAHVNLECTSC